MELSYTQRYGRAKNLGHFGILKDDLGRDLDNVSRDPRFKRVLPFLLFSMRLEEQARRQQACLLGTASGHTSRGKASVAERVGWLRSREGAGSGVGGSLGVSKAPTSPALGTHRTKGI